MNQTERRLYLIHELLNEQPMYANVNIPKDEPGQRNLLRSLANVRPPAPVSDEFLSIQDEYLQKLNEERGVVRVEKCRQFRHDGLLPSHAQLHRQLHTHLCGRAASQCLQ